jgi:hypothetical protein
VSGYAAATVEDASRTDERAALSTQRFLIPDGGLAMKPPRWSSGSTTMNALVVVGEMQDFYGMLHRGRVVCGPQPQVLPHSQPVDDSVNSLVFRVAMAVAAHHCGCDCKASK